MAPVCCSCDVEFTKADRAVPCQGWCTSGFHLSCSGLTEDQFVMLRSCDQLFWTCIACRNFRKNPRTVSMMAMTPGTHSDLSSAVSELKGELLKELSDKIVETIKPDLPRALKAEIRTSNMPPSLGQLPQIDDSLLPQSHYYTPVASPLLMRDVNTAPVTITTKSHTPHTHTTTTVSPPPMIQGNGAQIGDLTLATVPLPVPKTWLYFSRITPCTTEDQFKAWAMNYLPSEDLVVYKLIRKDCNLDDLSFASFKLGIPANLREKALNPSNWSSYVRMREFIDKRTRHTALGVLRAAQSTFLSPVPDPHPVQPVQPDFAPGTGRRPRAEPHPTGRTTRRQALQQQQHQLQPQ